MEFLSIQLLGIINCSPLIGVPHRPRKFESGIDLKTEVQGRGYIDFGSEKSSLPSSRNIRMQKRRRFLLYTTKIQIDEMASSTAAALVSAFAGDGLC